MHVLEAESDDWNRGHATARAGHAPVVLVEWARRQQGLIVAPGLAAVPRQLGLPFVPTLCDHFDLLVDRHAWFEPPMPAPLRFARSDAFAAKARALGSYDIAELGTVHWNAA